MKKKPFKTKADFAIVTALDIELEAVRRHLDEQEAVQEDTELFTYYYGHVRIPGADEHYTVVVIKLLGMGNDEAAVATTQLIQHCQPSSVLMVGIAGGVRGKVELGDVIVADFCYYYEPAKIASAGEERRPQQFPSDRLLYSRANAYEASEWKGQIRVARPGTPEQASSLPKARFGPIASGEKVIANKTALRSLLKGCPKLLAVAMEGAGVARAAMNRVNAPRFLEIRGICDFADSKKNDVWHEYAADAAAAFTIGFLRSLSPESLPAVKRSPDKAAPPLLVLCAHSLRPIVADELSESFEDDFKERELETVSLDSTDLVTGGRSLTDPETAARRLTDPQGALLGALARRGEAELLFHGLVHIPLAVLAGHLVTDRQAVRLFDFHPSPGSGSWTWPGDGEGVPPLEVSRLPEQQLRRKGDVVIRVSISYSVTPSQTRAIIPRAALEVDLSVPHPERNIVRSDLMPKFCNELDQACC